MIKELVKRDGRVVRFDRKKVADAIFNAAIACGGTNRVLAETLTDEVVVVLNRLYSDSIPNVEQIQDAVEKVLVENGHAQTVKAFILYREKHKDTRELNALINKTANMFEDYLQDADWNIKENANMQKSVNGLNNYIREAFTKNYWLHKIYPNYIRKAHIDGDLHLHDLGFFGPYCAGWDIKQLLEEGFGGVEGKVESGPAKHLRSFLGQLVNSTFTTQGETAGAQAWSSFDTYCAPFIRKDNMTFQEVKQCIQEFVFNINVPTRVGFQCPFSNVTLDIKVPKTLEKEAVVLGGKFLDTAYGDYQKEMDIFNLAFCEVMLEGDSKGRVFTFPIPTINITKDFDWNTPVVDAIMKMTCKYGIPYFANYVNSDLSPDDAVSMCCRLRLDTTALKKRGGGLFGSNPLTGSIGIVTINLPRIGYTSNTKGELFDKLRELAYLGKEALEIKRKIIEHQSNQNLYPYSTHYLRRVKERTNQYWFNHFNTIGIVGMNEMLLNFNGSDTTTPEGVQLSIDVMNELRSLMLDFQNETGHMYNLEATPAEGTSYRFAQADLKKFPDIIQAGELEKYYTNSTQLPVGYTDDILETVRLQDEVQSLYTGGTVQHLYLGERVEDPEVVKALIRKIFNQSSMPYISITPTFSICNNHGYIAGEHFICPECGEETEVYTRVTGYLRPVKNFNKGKREEYRQRVKYVIKKEQIM